MVSARLRQSLHGPASPVCATGARGCLIQRTACDNGRFRLQRRCLITLRYVNCAVSRRCPGRPGGHRMRARCIHTTRLARVKVTIGGYGEVTFYRASGVAPWGMRNGIWSLDFGHPRSAACLGAEALSEGQLVGLLSPRERGGQTHLSTSESGAGWRCRLGCVVWAHPLLRYGSTLGSVADLRSNRPVASVEETTARAGPQRVGSAATA